MDVAKIFIDELRAIIRDELNEANAALIKEHYQDKWVNKKELAEYLNVSESWVNQNLKDIPHVTHPIRFKKIQVDEWRQKQQNTTDLEEPVVKTRKTKNTFKII